MIEMMVANVYIDGAEGYAKNVGDMINPYRTVVHDAVFNGKGNLVSSTFNADFEDNIKKLMNDLNEAVKAMQALQ